MAQSRLTESSHGSKGRLNLIQKEVSVTNWLHKIIGQLRGTGLVLLNLSVNRQTKREPELRLPPDLQPARTFLWTREEAEAAWTEKRTEVNLAILSGTGTFMVDGSPARVEVCLNQEVKQWILTPPDKRLAQAREKERLEREQDGLERQKWAKFPPDPTPIEGRVCSVCGGNLVLDILNYYCEQGTDVITPADTAEKCLSCGKVTVI